MNTIFTQRFRFNPVVIGLLVLAALAIFAYLPTLQTIINGADHYTMIDVGETQVVLNVWGTLHATGYPHYVILSSTLTAILKLFGASPATAPSLTSLVYGLAALGVLYAFMFKISSDALIAGAVVLVFGLTRTVWLHHSIAEIYTFGLLILIVLLALALWRDWGTDSASAASGDGTASRLFMLAVIGGIGIAHHRALAMAIPALVYAMLPVLRAQGRKLPRVLITCLLLGIVGFLPYAYLMIRAQAGAAWVYGEPGTLSGLWDQFIGREAARFIGGVSSFESLIANFQAVTGVLFTDLHPIGVIVGVCGLIIGAARVHRRRVAMTVILSGMVAYLFHVFFYTDILSALILAVELSLAFGWLFIAEIAFAPFDYGHLPVLPSWATLLGAAVLAAVGLSSLHFDFINALTTDQTGVESTHLLDDAPPNSTIMVAWGSRHFAVGFAHDVLGQRRDVTLIDHKADFRAALERGILVTPDYTFYSFSLDWWDDQIGARTYARAAAANLVEIDDTPILSDVESAKPFIGLARLACGREQHRLDVDWIASRTPMRDYSVFVHLVDADGVLIAQADQPTPVFNVYPTSRWSPQEIVHGIYHIDAVDGAIALRYGLYYQADDGSFINEVESEEIVECRVNAP